MECPRTLCTLGMFILDKFEYLDETGQPVGREAEEQIGGGGTYASIGARMFLPDNQIAMIVDRGDDFPEPIRRKLESYGSDMWVFRDQPGKATTRALNLYRGELRGFEYLTPRIRITPKDFPFSHRSRYLHFICSPKRAQEIMAEVDTIPSWNPITVYEPIPNRCVPSELPALQAVLSKIHILSPNANEACSLLSIFHEGELEKAHIEKAAQILYEFGVGPGGTGSVVIRSGELGAYIKDNRDPGVWVDAYWKQSDRVIDVTGAGNAFLGGLAAGLSLCNGDVRRAAVYGTISASFTIEQHGLPSLKEGLWNGEDPQSRLGLIKVQQ